MKLSQSDSGSGNVGKSLGYLRREDIIGKSVVATDAVILGTVRDIAVSLDGKAALQVATKDGNNSGELFVGSDEIQALGDVVLLKYSSKRSQSATVTAPPAVAMSTPVAPAAPVASTMPPPPLYATSAGPKSARVVATKTRKRQSSA